MFTVVVQALFFFLPAYFANGAPVAFAKVKFLDKFKKPIDAGRAFYSVPLFGEHKTWYGFLIGLPVAIFTAILQFLFYTIVPSSRWIFIFNPVSFSSIVFLGFLLGFGALSGDLVKSFIKRRMRIPNGAPFVPFDQLDYVIGALLFVSLLVIPSFYHILVLLLASPLIHFMSNYVGYRLGLKKVWW